MPREPERDRTLDDEGVPDLDERLAREEPDPEETAMRPESEPGGPPAR